MCEISKGDSLKYVGQTNDNFENGKRYLVEHVWGDGDTRGNCDFRVGNNTVYVVDPLQRRFVK